MQVRDALAPEPDGVATTERIFGWIQAITDCGVRTADSPAAVAAAALLADEFRGMGLHVAIDETPTVDWRVHRHALALSDGAALPCTPIAHSFTRGQPCSFSTGPKGITAPIVDVGFGSQADFDSVDVAGKIVLADWSFARGGVPPDALYVQDSAETFSDELFVNSYSESTFPANFYRAMSAGAVGYVGALTDYYRDRHTLHNEAYDIYNGRPMTLPGLWVSGSTGDQLRRTLADGAAEVTLTLEGELVPATSRTVLGYLPGTVEDEIVLVESHYDSVTTGAVQDASGVAEVLALADYFSRLPREERGRTLLFAAFDTHMSDYAAHHNFVDKHVCKENIVLAIGLEHIAKEVIDGPNGLEVTELPVGHYCLVSPVQPLIDCLQEVIARYGLERTVLRSTASAAVREWQGDEELVCDLDYIWRAGTPVAVYIGGPGYIFDDVDTIDKVDREMLRPLAQAFAEVIRYTSALPGRVFSEGGK